MTEAEFLEENCENCIHLATDDTCGSERSVYWGRPVVYRDGDDVVQTAWCEHWEAASDA